MDSPDRDWLKTPEGREWLESDDGIAWERSDEGWEWMHSPDGRAWLDELAQRGYESAFAGNLPPPPEWAITPETAPLIGSRVRLSESGNTLDGTPLVKGELMIVEELRFSPVGVVWVSLRALDGRKLTTGMLGNFTPAS